ncbi:hypothetical protein WKI68_06725 [Streptomyces sp. MS1.HAVA.3]|uniref:Integral membrane protein n=1 Tax=Streptomyces caledonius TaxID=3134107 RepID=A0ABU8U063_9ACTN
MRVLRALTVTAAACAAIGLSVPIASANQNPGGQGGNGGPSNISVNPYAVHQGSTMQVSASGCGHGGTVTSHGNFPPANLSAGSIGFATVRIFNHASPGTHTLSVKCNDSSLVATARFRILEGNPSQGGIGGSFGPSTAETAIGAGLVGAAALGAGARVMRRRRPLRGRT